MHRTFTTSPPPTAALPAAEPALLVQGAVQVQGGTMPPTLTVSTQVTSYKSTVALGTAPPGSFIFAGNSTIVTPTGVTARLQNSLDFAQTKPLPGNQWGALGV